MALFAEAAKRGVPIFYNGPNWDFTRLPRYPTGVGYAPFVRGGRASDLDDVQGNRDAATRTSR